MNQDLLIEKLIIQENPNLQSENSLNNDYKKKKKLLGSKDLGFYVFRTLICIVGKP